MRKQIANRTEIVLERWKIKVPPKVLLLLIVVLYPLCLPIGVLITELPKYGIVSFRIWCSPKNVINKYSKSLGCILKKFLRSKKKK